MSAYAYAYAKVCTSPNSWFCFVHQQVNKLVKESQKCSCKGKKAPLCSKNGGAESKKEGRSKGGSSGDEESTGTEPRDTNKENAFATATS